MLYSFFVFDVKGHDSHEGLLPATEVNLLLHFWVRHLEGEDDILSRVGPGGVLGEAINSLAVSSASGIKPFGARTEGWERKVG